MYIITAIPGACSDLVSAVIDSTDCYISPKGQIGFLHQDRKLLKHPNIDEGKISEMIEAASRKYNSISSQYSKIINQQDVTNQYITVDVTDDYSFDWCIARLKVLWYNHPIDKNNFKNEIVWHRDYADKVINLRDILSGNLINVLSEIVPTPLNESLYQQWLSIINNKFPHNFV